ncbi:MAG: hypothetical protein WBP57_02095 [Ignavibacteria bacterium]|jgi:hypothetical protein|nr:MAG: hypothetical protein EDM69_07415 [Chlorobiota bacterium]KXK04691.1 MAG: hypothetical protein UZ04_CHB001001070 [Chlorobi bacterium OLB4]MBV6399446.1 hypothetical protein [Ignavibacteria bacterium]MCC6886710.1 hypothetical protein [Ignavibacteriales bacterium]MCE7953151.1 hypothetical protein [Chlorobi bacterium CHB7]OQY76601.1 MAG: hypothetical protein B6D43_10520 [Ignavibacteriales bacterium UTCHB1]RIK50025.1 MAG: hypothetical protein DCC60_01230 [Ignavibacteriota bacterium]
MKVIEWDIKLDSFNADEIVNDSVNFFQNGLSYLPDEYREGFLIELKIIIFEMLTNVKSHGGGSSLKLKYCIADDHVSLEFISDGNGFRLQSQHDDILKDEVITPPFPDKYVGKQITIYKGIEEELKCNVAGQNKLEFMITPKSVLQTASELHEHFGLQIIATVSEKFEYFKTTDSEDIFLIYKKIKV